MENRVVPLKGDPAEEKVADMAWDFSTDPEFQKCCERALSRE